MADPSDLARIEQNLRKMVSQGATARQMDQYLSGEGFTRDSFKQALENSRRQTRYFQEPTSQRPARIVAERFTEPFVQTGRAIARGLIGPDPYLQPRVFGAQEQVQQAAPPLLEPQDPIEKILAGVGSGLGGVGTTMGVGGLLRAMGAAAPAEALMAYPGMQTVSGVAGGVAGELTGHPLIGLAAGLATPLGLTVGKGAWARIFDRDKPYDKAHEIFLKDYVKRLEDQGRSISDLRAKIAAAPENTPLAAIDPVAEQLLRESINRPEVKRALKGFGPTAGAERFITGTVGYDPAQVGENIKKSMSKSLGAPTDVTRAERVLDALITRENKRARKTFLFKDLPDERISDLNDLLLNNPRYQSQYDKFVDALRDSPDFSPMLPNDNRRARDILARYEKILQSGKKDAEKTAAKLLKDAGYESEAHLLEERFGTKGLTEDLFDSFTRFMRDPAHESFEQNTVRNAINRVVGSTDIKFVDALEKLRAAEAEPWKQELNRLYTLKNALSEGKTVADNMLKGAITPAQAREMLAKYGTDEGKEFFRRGFLDRINLNIEDDPLSALRNLPRSPNDRQVVSEIFGAKKADDFYNSLPGMETQAFAERTKSALRAEQPELPTPAKTLSELGVQSVQAMQKYIRPLWESITATVKDRQPTYYPRVREMVGQEALRTDKAAQQRFMDELARTQQQLDAWRDKNFFQKMASHLLTGGGKVASEIGPYLSGFEAGYRPFRPGGPLVPKEVPIAKVGGTTYTVPAEGAFAEPPKPEPTPVPPQ
jgi:hypothetical protein